MSLLKRAAALLGAIVLALTGLAVVAPAAHADPGWDTGIPTSWRRASIFAGTENINLNSRRLVFEVDQYRGDGWGVQLGPALAHTNQIWAMQAASEGGFYYHAGYDQSLCLDFDGDPGYGNQLKVRNCDGSASQRWFPIWRDGGFELATHSDRKWCVDVPNSNFAAPQQGQIWNCNHTAAQFFTESGCHGWSCTGLWPDQMGCDLDATTVSDTTGSDGTRITVHTSGYRCLSVWTKMTLSSVWQLPRWAEIRAYPSGGSIYYRNQQVSPGNMVWTPMLDRTPSGTVFKGCLVNELNNRDGWCGPGLSF
ncbi:hypothetical protein F4553_001762 [Allocatelliglobosispora scoriae]|uniref:Ricin B lectin domain-containing protein n=1 Tax=Allocatelliglobosispora scoriae TaxID=643052 RepID=A0A841BN52_9ACTN|nr:ricin-type beta-trefoil lectin domain protein [Allocatelliglobosispora scoriae]MBB5868383.1 hypothetical protein [Allocatelliglobosispora scoriae]